MAISPYSQQMIAAQYKNALKSYNAQYDVVSVGTYWDVTANATAAIFKEMADWTQQVSDGNIPDNATPVLLEYWVTSLNMVPRRTGAYASGNLSADRGTPFTGSVTVPAGSIFSVANLKYTSTKDVTIDGQFGAIPVVADQTGAEYNLAEGVGIQNSVGIYKTTSAGVLGGTSVESDSALLSRLKLNISRRKTDGMVSDYLQRALGIYSYAEVETIFVDNVIPYGVSISVANTIQNFDTAAASPIINEVHIDDLTLNESQLLNYSTVTAVVELSSPYTQVIDNMVIYIITNDGTDLTTEEVVNVRTATRKALLEFGGNVLTRFSLTPDFSNILNSTGVARVEDYHFNSFAPIHRISPLFDSINIGVVSANS